LRQHELASTGDEARAALALYLAQTIRPPGHSHPHRHGVIGYCVHFVRAIGRSNRAPLNDYLAETRGSIKRRGWKSALDPLWHTYRVFMNLFGGPADSSEPMPEPHGPIETYWEAHYQNADTLSARYGDRYRSSYILVFLIAAVVALVAPRIAGLAVVVELLGLAGIAALVVMNANGRWHERWITYRLLAELCRKQRILSPLGRALPGVEVFGLATDAATDAHAGTDRRSVPREIWVGWYFAALQRAAPMPSGPLSGRALHRAAQVGRALLAEQIAYHNDRERRHRAASQRLARSGDLIFLFTLAVVFMRFILLPVSSPATWLHILVLACAILPTISALLLGIRAYAEFDLLVQESARMLRVMKAAEATICDMNFDEPLASQDLGAELSSVAMAMLHDVKGWAQLFRVKAVETG
jgi:hypothetical protein